MLIAGIVLAALLLTLAIGSYFAAYHAIQFAAPQDRTRTVLWVYLLIVAILLAAEIVVFFQIDWRFLES